MPLYLSVLDLIPSIPTTFAPSSHFLISPPHISMDRSQTSKSSHSNTRCLNHVTSTRFVISNLRSCEYAIVLPRSSRHPSREVLTSETHLQVYKHSIHSLSIPILPNGLRRRSFSPSLASKWSCIFALDATPVIIFLVQDRGGRDFFFFRNWQAGRAGTEFMIWKFLVTFQRRKYGPIWL